MRTNILLVAVILFTLSIAGNYFLFSQWRKADADFHRMESNFNAEHESLQTYITENGRIAAKTTVQELTIKELEATNNYLLREIKNLKLKPKRVENISVTATETKIKIDSIPVIRKDSVDSFSYTDSSGFFSIQGKLDSSKTYLKDVSIEIKDTLVVAIAFERKWFLGRKTYKCFVTSKNPYIKITYNKYIIIKKKRFWPFKRT